MKIEDTFERRAKSVHKYGEFLRKAFYGGGGSWTHGEHGVISNGRYTVHGLEEDDNGTPGGTTGFDGQAVAFIVYEGEGAARREYRVVIEDITLDDEILAR